MACANRRLVCGGKIFTRYACLGLAQVSSPAAATRMIEVVRDHRLDDIARGACAFALGYSRNVRASDALIEVLSHGNEETQRHADEGGRQYAASGSFPAQTPASAATAL